MLYTICDNGTVKRVDYTPNESEYRIWRSRLADPDFQAVHDELLSRIEGTEVQTAGWIPGHDWTGTVFEPLYYACNQDIEASGKFFGLICWEVFREHELPWSFGRYEKDGIPIQSMTYFRINV